ncbi:hypothetical protein ACIBBD_26320 [Streptomyces sp. NPDC051315]|uniref:hypothetical protein n=1 Tax=Streptomyces sp. NPDC051315 TaxID=3365650 RepID=UPI00379A1E22
MTTMTTGAEKRLEGGWFQRLAWVVLAWGSLGMLVWVPFLYVAIRRGRGSDWGAFAAFALYEVITLPWAVADETDGDAFLGIAVLVTLATATWMLLLAVFDKRVRTAPAMAYGTAPAPQGHPYQQGYPYGR